MLTLQLCDLTKGRKVTPRTVTVRPERGYYAVAAAFEQKGPDACEREEMFSFHLAQGGCGEYSN